MVNPLWGLPMPPEGHPPVISVRAGDSLEVVACGAALSVATHWVDNRCVPCEDQTVNHQVCPHLPQKRRWKSFLPAATMSRRKIVVELTLGACRQVPDVLTPQIAGRRLRIRRAGQRNNGPLLLVVVETATVYQVTAFDVRPSVLALWETPG